ncbi:hypothetical protein PF003_g12905 [Phytophthora fragariae]|nr:hypothetical protein PF003_g12905 [Phytophthora fragariae]
MDGKAAAGVVYQPAAEETNHYHNHWQQEHRG